MNNASGKRTYGAYIPMNLWATKLLHPNGGNTCIELKLKA